MSNDPLKSISLENSLNHYDILGIHPTCSVIEIRRSYRKLSKLYHPDTTELPSKIATVKFQRLNEAYAILSQPHLRLMYDYEIGYSRVNVIQSHQDLADQTSFETSRSAYLDPSDRPLSSGEIFALFMLGVTVIGCLLLALAIAYFRQDSSFVL
jgi:curved DNA-binding protein CbpA